MISPVYQSESSDCGFAAIAMILNFYGLNIKLSDLRNHLRDRPYGISAREIIYLSNKYDINSRALRIDLADLTKIKLPAILHWNMNHYVVLERIQSGEATIYDPAYGKRVVKQKELNESFTGICFEFSPSPNIKPIQQGENRVIPDYLHLIIKNIASFKKIAIPIILISIATQLLVAYFPTIVQRSIDDPDPGNTMLWAAIIFGMWLLPGISEYVRSNLLSHFSVRVNLQLGKLFVRKLILLNADYFKRRSTGSILTRIDSIAEVRKLISNEFLSIFIDSIFLCTSIFFLVKYNYQFALITVSGCLLILLIYLVNKKEIRECLYRQLDYQSKSNSNLLETIQSIESIRATGSEELRYHQWLNLTYESAKAEIKSSQLYARIDFFRQLSTAIELSLLTFLIITFSKSGLITIGAIAAIYSLRMTFNSRFVSLIDNITGLNLIAIHLSRLDDILDSLSNGDDNADIKHGALTIKNVSFSYGIKNILSNANLRIYPGEHIVITGESGIGKSTFINIVSGNLLPENGQVFIDDNEVNADNYRSIQKHMGIVSQGETHIFEGTFEDNITMFDPSPDESYFDQIIKTCLLDDVLSNLPSGKKSMMVNGTVLSGGQLQRLVLARALYKKPKILILDEATSNLDAGTEEKLMQNIIGLKMTTISITHRSSILGFSDRCFELKNSTLREI